MLGKYYLVSVLILLFIQCLGTVPSPDIHISINSFIGTDYLPDLAEKEFSYFERLYYKIGGNLQIYDTGAITLDFMNQGSANKQSLMIDRFFFTHSFPKIIATLGYDVIEIGKSSEIFSLNVKNAYFDTPLFADYHYSGFKLVYALPKFQLKGSIGGNQFNSAIYLTSLSYTAKKINLGLHYLFTGRSNEQNLATSSITEEFELKTDLFRFYQAANIILTKKVTNYSWKSRDILNFFGEFFINITSNLRTGTNLLYNYNYEPTEDISWQSQSFLKASIKEFSIIPQFRYYHTDAYLNREMQILLSINIYKLAWIGASASYFNPSIGSDYYQLGFKINFKYESD